MYSRWRTSKNAWAGGDRINRALRDRNIDLLQQLLVANPGLLVWVFHHEQRERDYSLWKASRQGTLAHAVIDLDWEDALEVLHETGETFTRLMAHPLAGKSIDTPLAMAVRLGRREMVRNILQWGAPATGIQMQPLVLDALAMNTGEEQTRAMIDLLAQHGAKADVLCSPVFSKIGAKQEEKFLWAHLLDSHHGMGLPELLAHARDDEKTWLSHPSLWDFWSKGYTDLCATNYVHQSLELHDLFLSQGASPMDADQIVKMADAFNFPYHSNPPHRMDRMDDHIAFLVRTQIEHIPYAAGDLRLIEAILSRQDLADGNPLNILRAEIASTILGMETDRSDSTAQKPRL